MIPGQGRRRSVLVGVGVVVAAAIAAVLFGSQQPQAGDGQDVHITNTSAVTDISCDADNQCPDGLSCYGLPGVEGFRCVEGDPCSALSCTECAATRSQPPSVFCTG